MAESAEVLVLGGARNAFEADENVFEAGEIAARDSDTAEGFEESGKQGAGFRALFLGESGKGALAELFGNLIGPEGFKKRGEFAEACGDDAAGAGIHVLESAGVIQKNGAGFTARGIGPCFDEKVHGLADGGDGDAPDVRAAEDGGFFAGRKLQPEAFDDLLAVGFVGPGGGERGEMLRRVRAVIAAGVNDDTGELIQNRTDGMRRDQGGGKFGS